MKQFITIKQIIDLKIESKIRDGYYRLEGENLTLFKDISGLSPDIFLHEIIKLKQFKYLDIPYLDIKYTVNRFCPQHWNVHFDYNAFVNIAKIKLERVSKKELIK